MQDRYYATGNKQCPVAQLNFDEPNEAFNLDR